MYYAVRDMQTWIKWVIGAGIILGIGGFIGWRVLAGNIKTPVRTVTANYQTVTRDIAFTASVTSKQSSSLAFELTGSVQALYAHVGDTVVKGQRLALLNPESVDLELAKAKADKASTSSVEYITWQKDLEDLKNTKAENAKTLEQKQQSVRDAKIAASQSRGVFDAKVDESGEGSSSALATYSTVIANETAYNAARKTLATTTETIKKSNASAQKAADIAYAQYVSTFQASTSNTGLSSLDALEQLAQAKAAKSILRAPFNGVVTKRSVEIGELATAGKELFVVETTSQPELTAQIPETDALALGMGLPADVTFDALPHQAAISTSVISIDPAAVIIQGVPTFKITLPIENPPTALRPGLTSNVIVHIAKKDHVLGIPRRALITKSGEEFVKIQHQDKSTTDVKVTTGLVGSDGIIEITSGLSEGEVVVTP